MKRRHQLAALTGLLLILMVGLAAWPAAAQDDPGTGPYVEYRRLGRGAARCVAWSPAGDLIAVGGVLGVWLYTPDLQDVGHLTGHTRGVYGVAFSPDGSQLASASHDGTVRVWDVAAQAAVRVLAGHGGLVVAVAWSPDGGALASAGYDGEVRLWDAATGALRGTFYGPAAQVNGIAWTADGAPYAVGGAGYVTRQLSPDGTRWAVADWDGPVQVWDADGQTLLAEQLDHLDWIVAVSWEGDTLRADRLDGRALGWEVGTGLRVAAGTADLNRPPAPDSALYLAPDGGRRVEIDAGGVVRVWDTAGGTLIAVLPGRANAAAWHAGGQWLAIAQRNGTITIWRAEEAGTDD